MVSVEKSEVVPERLESAENIKLERLVKAARKQAKLRDGEARKVKGVGKKKPQLQQDTGRRRRATCKTLSKKRHDN